MSSKGIILLLLLSWMGSLLCKAQEVSCYVSKKMNDTICIGNGIIKPYVWCQGNGLYIMVDTTKLRIEARPCVWDLGYMEKLDYNEGVISIKNAYIKLSIFVQRDSPVIWIKGRTDSEVSVTGDGGCFQTERKGLKNFILRISSSGDSERISYSKAKGMNSVYWNEFWQRSYISISGKDSILTKNYNERRWISAISSRCDNLDFLIKSGDWDIFKEQIEKKEQDMFSLALMMEYFQYSEDEQFLHKTIVPLAENLLAREKESPYYEYICQRLKELPEGVMIPDSLFRLLPEEEKQCDINLTADTLQDIVYKGDFPKEWNIRYKLRTAGKCYIKMEKGRTRIIHQDLFL